MGILKKLLELYKETLKMEDEKYEHPEIPKVHINKEEYKKILKEFLEEKTEKQSLEEPIQGIVFELVPSLDSQEMLFLTFNVGESFTTIFPLSKWWEFATPKDVLIEVDKTPYIVQTDMPIDIPTMHFTNWFSDRILLKIAKLNDEILRRVEKVYKGIERGDGRFAGGEKEEFKKLEAKRYIPLWLGIINQIEELAKLNEELIHLKQKEIEISPFKAHEKQPVHGKGKNLEFFYNEKEELLYIYPQKEFIGKKGKVILKIKNKKLMLYDGILKKEIKIPISSKAYDYRLFAGGLELEFI